MKRVLRQLGVPVFLSGLLLGTTATPAAAHGSCSAYAYAPNVGLLTQSYFGQFDCTYTHELFVTACLQKFTPVLGWANVSCSFGHGVATTHVHAAGTAAEVCVTGTSYRTFTDGYNAVGTHYDYDYSSTVSC